MKSEGLCKLRWIHRNEEVRKITRERNVNHSLVMVGKLAKIFVFDEPSKLMLQSAHQTTAGKQAHYGRRLMVPRYPI